MWFGGWTCWLEFIINMIKSNIRFIQYIILYYTIDIQIHVYPFEELIYDYLQTIFMF